MEQALQLPVEGLGRIDLAHGHLDDEKPACALVVGGDDHRQEQEEDAVGLSSSD